MLSILQELFNKQPSYRLKQAQKVLFADLIDDWQQALVLPIVLRVQLNEKFPIGILAKTFVSKDGKAVKALISLKDGLKIETILMRHKDARPACNVSQAKRSDAGRNTVCLSSQVGCALGCGFCATGQLGFKRNLEVWEIIQQVLFFARYLKQSKEKITNIVFMGMGEPFLNYDKAMQAIRILNDKDGFNLGARHFSISTIGVVEGIEKLAKENLQVNLAVSLHAPDDELRSKLMSINKKYPIREILRAVDVYIKKTNRRVMFEYIMIRDVNDSEKQAIVLARLMKKPLYFVNLIPCNPTGVYRASDREKIKKFKEILEKEGVAVTQRYGFGHDIAGACGQLGAKYGII